MREGMYVSSDALDIVGALTSGLERVRGNPALLEQVRYVAAWFTGRWDVVVVDEPEREDGAWVYYYRIDERGEPEP